MLSTIQSKLSSMTERNINFSDIMNRGFKLIQIFSARLRYSIDDYEQRQIPRTFRTLRLAIWTTMNAWATLLTFYFVIFFNNNNHLLINLNILELISNTKRLDLFFMAILIIFTIMEIMWLELFQRILFYQSPMNDFLIVCFQYNEKKLLQKYRKFLIDFHIISNLVGICLYSISTVIILLMSLIYAIYMIEVYLNHAISMIQMVITTIIFIPVFVHIIFIMGQIFLAINFLVFLIEFLKKRFEQLANISNTIYVSFNKKTEYGIILFNRFRYDYIQLFKETKRFNGTISFLLLYMETGSKAWSIIFCIFYSQQIQMNLIAFISGFILISLYFFMIGLYSRLAQMPLNNQLCRRRLAFWMAEQSRYWNKFKHRNYHQQKCIRILMIKLNFFIQIMAHNRFGFTCGRLFFITKFKYIELFLMNVPIIMLFYRKICMMDN